MAGATQAGAEALAELSAAAAAEPDALSVQRDPLAARLRASDESSEELLAAVQSAMASAPNDLSLQLTYIDTVAQLAEEAAEREDYRAALGRLGVVMDAIDIASATDAERIAVDGARVRVLSLSVEILERNDSIDDAMDSLALRNDILKSIVDANPASAEQREQYALSMVELGGFMLRYDYVTTSETGERGTGSPLVVRGVNMLREAAAADASNPTAQLIFAGAQISGATDWLSAEPESAEAGGALGRR